MHAVSGADAKERKQKLPMEFTHQLTWPIVYTLVGLLLFFSFS
jgi:hypothetical protein